MLWEEGRVSPSEKTLCGSYPNSGCTPDFDPTTAVALRMLLSTGLFGKLTSREDPDLDFGGHFKYDLHPEEKLASSYFGKLNSVKHRMDRVIMKCINLVRMDHYILFMMGIYVSRHHCKRSCYR